MRSARRARHLVAAALFFSTGCTLLVSRDLSNVHCKDEGAVGPPACPGDSICRGGLCVEIAQPLSKLDAACSANEDCAPGEICLDPTSFGGTGSKVCSRTCCSASECDDPNLPLVCWAAPMGGGHFCRRAGLVGLAVLGELGPAEACNHNAECRSGVCQGGICLETCCSDANCSAGSAPGTCRLATYNGAETWSCGPVAPASAAFLDACTSDGDCASGLCLSIAGSMRCSMPCCGSTACGAIDEGRTTSHLGCAPVMRSGSMISACSRVLPETAVGAVGSACFLDADCRGGVCGKTPSGNGECSDPCCVDADCADPAFACRPRAQGGTWALRCERK